jgi:Fe-S cluster assembly protein SufD
VQHSRNALDNAPSHWQYLNVRLQAGAQYQLNNHVAGCGSRRQDIHIIMDGQGAEATLVSAGKVDGKMALDQQVTLEHRQPRGQSKQTVHNIVANGGKCTFNGRIHIHEGAAGTDAQLSNKNLGMGEHATINTKPELEIYTDDVSCSHGATVGTISQDALFYLTSRGIDRTAAEALLSQGFLRQCIDGPLADQALTALVGGAREQS